MRSYDPEMVNTMRDALEQAWELLPKTSKSSLPKVDLADRILRKAATGERDLSQLRAAALVGTGMEPRPLQ
jgi:hypothetical protein